MSLFLPWLKYGLVVSKHVLESSNIRNKQHLVCRIELLRLNYGPISNRIIRLTFKAAFLNRFFYLKKKVKYQTHLLFILRIFVYSFLYMLIKRKSSSLRDILNQIQNQFWTTLNHSQSRLKIIRGPKQNQIWGPYKKNLIWPSFITMLHLNLVF